MKGIIFTALNDMVVEKFGFDTWESLITTVSPPSGGIYTAGDTYSFKELQLLINELSSMLNIEPSHLIEAYGEYMFPILATKYPIFLPKNMTFNAFLKSIHQVIHIEVKKLYPDASLPTILYEEPHPKKIVLNYHSPRKLCFLAIGLVRGAAKHFAVDVDIEQPICMHRNADHCRLEITMKT